MKTVLVTGANGFIGTRLCQQLLAAGYRVRGAVREARPLPEGVEGIAVGPLRPETDWRQTLQGIDTVVHLAAKVHDLRRMTPEMERDYWDVNTRGTETLARAAADGGVRCFLLASSVKAMAESTDFGPPLTEDMPARPEDAYGRSKLEAEGRLAAVAAGGGMRWMALRLPLVYGPGAGGNLRRLMRLVEKRVPLPLGLVNNRRSFLGLDNLTDLLLRAITVPDFPSGVYLASDGEDHSTPSLIRQIGEAMGRTPLLLPIPSVLLRVMAGCGDLLLKLAGRPTPGMRQAMDRLTGSLAVDSRRIRQTLAWEPPCRPAQGIREMVRHFLATPADT